MINIALLAANKSTANSPNCDCVDQHELVFQFTNNSVSSLITYSDVLELQAFSVGEQLCDVLNPALQDH